MVVSKQNLVLSLTLFLLYVMQTLQDINKRQQQREERAELVQTMRLENERGGHNNDMMSQLVVPVMQSVLGSRLESSKAVVRAEPPAQTQSRQSAREWTETRVRAELKILKLDKFFDNMREQGMTNGNALEMLDENFMKEIKDTSGQRMTGWQVALFKKKLDEWFERV